MYSAKSTLKTHTVLKYIDYKYSKQTPLLKYTIP